jgi:LacI family transcriptional regulator
LSKLDARRKPPTLRDVAKAAGVGTTTASRAINGGHYVAPKLLAHIQHVMAELGYRPNQFARSLKSNRSKTIGLIIPFITDPFFAEFAAEVESVARGADYVVILATSLDKPQFEAEDLAIFERHRVDGLLLVPPRTESKAVRETLRAMSVPVVAFDRPLSGREYSSVTTNNRAAAQLAVQHLIDHGRRRILCLGGDPSLLTIRERTEGYKNAVTQAGIEILIHHDADDLNTIVERYVTGKQKVDAIFGLYHQPTLIAYEVMKRLRLRIPEDVSVINFGDFASAAMLEPSITVVEQPVAEIARTAARLLLDLVQGITTSSQQIQIASQLKFRRSCGCEPTK